MTERGPLVTFLAFLAFAALRYFRNRPGTAVHCRHGYPRGPWGSRGMWGSDHQTVDEWGKCVAQGKAGVPLSEDPSPFTYRASK